MKKGLVSRATFAAMVLLIAVSTAHSDLGPAHKKRLPRPVKLGSSGGNVTDQTSQFCCSGTLGAVVQDAQGKKYILSNNHVLAKGNKAQVGNLVSQPGNIDVNCSPKSSDTVATLSKWINIKFGTSTNNRVDMALAQVVPGKVSSTGFIMDIQNPGQPVNAALNMRVKKSGRTTGLRRGIIEVLNLTVQVRIPNQCGSNSSKIARFVDQIGVADAPSGTPAPFIAGGDSGSLLVQDLGSCPGTVGLLFAGDDIGNAVANRIQNVLSQFGGLRMVGCGTAAAADEDEYSALQLEHPSMIRALAVQARYQDALLAIPGVQGVGIGLARPGSTDLALVVYTVRGTRAAEAADILPQYMEQLPVRRIISGEFVAF